MRRKSFAAAAAFCVQMTRVQRTITLFATFVTALAVSALFFGTTQAGAGSSVMITVITGLAMIPCRIFFPFLFRTTNAFPTIRGWTKPSLAMIASLYVAWRRKQRSKPHYAAMAGAEEKPASPQRLVQLRKEHSDLNRSMEDELDVEQSCLCESPSKGQRAAFPPAAVRGAAGALEHKPSVRATGICENCKLQRSQPKSSKPAVQLSQAVRPMTASRPNVRGIAVLHCLPLTLPHQPFPNGCAELERCFPDQDVPASAQAVGFILTSYAQRDVCAAIPAAGRGRH